MNQNKIKQILKEYTHGHDISSDLTMYDEPTSYSKSSLGRDFREKIFDLEGSNRMLLQLIDDFNDFLISNPTEMTNLSKQLQNKLPETIQMLQVLDPDVRTKIMNRFIPKLKIDFFSLYSMVSSEYTKHQMSSDFEEIEPEIETEEPMV